MAEHFSGDWYFIENLGEGSFGQVKLARNKKTGDFVAVKVIDLQKVPDKKDVEREICILKLINHPYIYKYYGHKKSDATYYIFFEYLTGGELLNWIDPGHPLKEIYAFKFSSQILEAINYLHSLGIVHRDIKLENIMLDINNDVKLIDFGLSTLFMSKGSERSLAKRCGSLPYTAPEVLSGNNYRAKSADLWSFGVLLFVFFSGELPWEIACDESVEFRNFKLDILPSTVWNQLSQQQLVLMKGIFSINPSVRFTYEDITQSQWYVRMKHHSENNDYISQTVEFSQNDEQSNSIVCLSQMNSVYPNELITGKNCSQLHPTDLPKFNPFSQPMNTDDYCPTQGHSGLTYSQKSQKLTVNNITKRLTRFYVKNCEAQFLIKCISDILNSYLLQWSLTADHTIFSISSVDGKKLPILFKIILSKISEGYGQHPCLVVHVKRFKGDGLKFKKFYDHLKQDISRLVSCSDDLN